MAANLLPQKQALASNVAVAAANVLQGIQTLARAIQEGSDLGMASGGANAFVDSDFQNSNNDHITAASFYAALGIVSTIDSGLAANSRAGYKALQAVVRNPT